MHITVQENLITYPNIKPAKKANARENNVHTTTQLNQALNPKIRLKKKWHVLKPKKTN